MSLHDAYLECMIIVSVVSNTLIDL